MNEKLNETLNMRISKEMFEKIKEISNGKGIPYSELIRMILDDYLKQ